MGNKTREEIIEERSAGNMKNFLQGGARLSSKYKSWVVARDRAKGMVLMGGLGCMGVGEMWFKDAPGSHYQDDPTYADAPEMEWITDAT